MTRLDYLNEYYPARKSDSEKHAFRRYIVEEMKKKGIDAHVEETKDGKNKNIVIGTPTTAKAVFTAHYDTPYQSLFPNIMLPKNRPLYYAYQFLPVIFLLIISFALAYLIGKVLLQDDSAYLIAFLVIYYGAFFLMMRAFPNQNNYNDNTSGVATVLSVIDNLGTDELQSVAFILFDNEEKGKKGSAAYFKDHKSAMQDKFLINFDCVGNGENIIFIAQKNAVDTNEYHTLKNSFTKDSNFNLDFCTYKDGESNSDHKNFPRGVACIACKKSKKGVLYTPRIHTSKDIVANNGNVDFLAKNTVNFISKIS